MEICLLRESEVLLSQSRKECRANRIYNSLIILKNAPLCVLCGSIGLRHFWDSVEEGGSQRRPPSSAWRTRRRRRLHTPTGLGCGELSHRNPHASSTGDTTSFSHRMLLQNDRIWK
ncbi:MAG: hypothetical protein DRQ24_07685 [Candidatus Latescibacterota bacterium]|nr:MAG: hypothetical protein DRQ24_07685 [Candidatus Latescibacterota bacterium]